MPPITTSLLAITFPTIIFFLPRHWWSVSSGARLSRYGIIKKIGMQPHFDHHRRYSICRHLGSNMTLSSHGLSTLGPDFPSISFWKSTVLVDFLFLSLPLLLTVARSVCLSFSVFLFCTLRCAFHSASSTVQVHTSRSRSSNPLDCSVLPTVSPWNPPSVCLSTSTLL